MNLYRISDPAALLMLTASRALVSSVLRMKQPWNLHALLCFASVPVFSLFYTHDMSHGLCLDYSFLPVFNSCYPG